MCRSKLLSSRVFRALEFLSVAQMFPEVYVIAWSAISFLMGAVVYFELQKYDDPLYHHQQSLLSQFPLDTTHCSNVGCNDADSTQQSLGVTSQDGYLSPINFTSLKIFLNTFLGGYNVTLWNRESTSSPLTCLTSCEVRHTKLHSNPVKEAGKDSGKGEKTGNHSKVLPSKTYRSTAQANVCYWSENQYYSNAISYKKFRIQAPFNYPVAIASQSNFLQIKWEHLLIIGGIFSTTVGVAVAVHVCLHCGAIMHKLCNKQEPPLPITDKSEDQVLIPVETLQLFKHNFELIVQHKNIHFRRAQQYFRAGLRVNMEKNTLSAENKALKREITCLKARLTNQGFYIEMLEKMNDVSDAGNILTSHIECSTRIESKQLGAERRMLGNAVDSKFCVLLDNECVSSDESQLTVVEEERPLYIAKPTSDASQCSSTGVVKSSFVEKIERRVQTCLNVSEGIKLNRRCLKASECRESLVLEDSLQRREQICPNISEIIEDEKRLNHILFPAGSFFLHFPSPQMHWQSPSNTQLVFVLTRRKKLISPSKSNTTYATASTRVASARRQSFSADDVNNSSSRCTYTCTETVQT